jgi:tRNA threonylcarbamoyladenosine biosynthesis protein TsaB
MLICAIDTSGREGSLALASGDERSFELLHFASIAGGTYSAQLIPTLSAALVKAGKERSGIGLLVVASGPGSFTGLRVGLGTVKALAEVLQVPVVAISVLEAIAFAAHQQGIVLAALDAQRNEVFVGEYEIAEGLSRGLPQYRPTRETENAFGIKTLHEALASGADFATWLSARIPVPVTYTPDAAIIARVREAGSPAEQIARPAADLYARLGLLKYLAGEWTAIETLDANYIRRSDAEIFSAPKLGIDTGKKS